MKFDVNILRNTLFPMARHIYQMQSNIITERLIKNSLELNSSLRVYENHKSMKQLYTAVTQLQGFLVISTFVFHNYRQETKKIAAFKIFIIPS